eukprot:12097_1
MATNCPLQQKNKWKSQQISKHFKNQKNCSSWRHYHQRKYYKQSLRKRRQNHIYNEYISRHSFYNNTRTSTKPEMMKSQNFDLDISIKICLIQDNKIHPQHHTASRTYMLFNVANIHLDIFDHLQQKYWTSYSFIPCYKYSNNSVYIFKLINDMKIGLKMNSRYSNYISTNANKNEALIKLADSTFKYRIPSAYLNHYFKQLNWKILEHKMNNDLKTILNETIPELWSLFQYIFDYLGYYCMDTITLKAIQSVRYRNDIPLVHRTIMNRYKPFDRKKRMIYIYDQNNRSNCVKIKSKAVVNRGIGYHCYENIPFVPSTDAMRPYITIDNIDWKPSPGIVNKYVYGYRWICRNGTWPCWFKGGIKLNAINSLRMYHSESITKHRKRVVLFCKGEWTHWTGRYHGGRYGYIAHHIKCHHGFNRK